MTREQVFMILQEDRSISDRLRDLEKALREMLDPMTQLTDVIEEFLGVDRETMVRIGEDIGEFLPDPYLEDDLLKLEILELQGQLIEENTREFFPHIIDFHVLGLLKEHRSYALTTI